VADTPLSLNALAARHGRRFGTCIGAFGTGSGSVDNLRYGAVTRPNAASSWPKPDEVRRPRPAPDRFDFAAADHIVAWAHAHGLAVAVTTCCGTPALDARLGQQP
jgi:GH35 family endo-1,4-beta-xylanase